ncbi:MAG TPA: ABC transporter ATP-binding protein/permease [Steroidobacteraceae bacterium]|nr:ABC transporter ATP-binding protein/permease [Steroidobacteraceae bacterium]
MIDRSEEIASTSTTADEAAGARLFPQLGTMARALWGSPVRNTLWLLWGAVVIVLAGTAYGQIRLNRWNEPFYNALSHHQFGAFLVQLVRFGEIAGALLVLNVAQRWLDSMLQLKLRQGLVHDLVRNWMDDRRAFRLAHAGPIGVNPDQRMHEDARHLTELSADLGIGLLQSSLLLILFVKVLWGISSGFVLRLGGHALSVPGYMVWAAVLYAGSASLLSYLVGRSLVARNAERYAREADLRFSLVRVNEHIDAIALAGGEADERRHIERDLQAVLAMMRRLVTGLTNLTWVTAGYGWFTLIAPILAAAPLYFHGELSFGGLMMAAGAFNQVQSSLRWFVDNFSTIADWRATLLRVAAFREAVAQTERFHSVQSRIEFVDGEPGRLLLEQLRIASPSGCTLLQEGSAQIKAGEHVLIVGEPGAGKTLLFRTLAGLWVWGQGRIVRPRHEEMLFIPRRSYLPPGTLRQVLAYPRPVESFQREAFAAALKRCGLEPLVAQLDEPQAWDRHLSDAEQSQLAIARAVLHVPGWIIIDDLFGTLSGDALERIHEVFATDLKRSAVIHIGANVAPPAQFARVLHLTCNPTSQRRVRETAVAA